MNVLKLKKLFKRVPLTVHYLKTFRVLSLLERLSTVLCNRDLVLAIPRATNRPFANIPPCAVSKGEDFQCFLAFSERIAGVKTRHLPT